MFRRREPSAVLWYTAPSVELSEGKHFSVNLETITIEAMLKECHNLLIIRSLDCYDPTWVTPNPCIVCSLSVIGAMRRIISKFLEPYDFWVSVNATLSKLRMPEVRGCIHELRLMDRRLEEVNITEFARVSPKVLTGI